VLFSLLLSCSNYKSSNKASLEKTKKGAKIPTPLPTWILQTPIDGSYTIGISRATKLQSDMYETAREMATIQYARNLSSFNIDKHIRANLFNEDLSQEEKRSLVFQVSDPHQIWDLHDRLSLVKHYVLHNAYFIGLFQYSDTFTYNDETTSVQETKLITDESTEQPKWYTTNEVIETINHVLSRESSTSACLIEAWKSANQKARLSLSAFHSLNVESLVESTTLEDKDRLRQVIALETLYNLKDIQLNRAFITTHYHENNISYTVFTELALSK
jgi:hypothetical protein